jgi:hypothetical protein
VKLQFVLSNSLTTNTILGFQSIVKMGLAMLLHKGYIHFEIFNKQFPVTKRVPARSPTPPNVPLSDINLMPTTLNDQGKYRRPTRRMMDASATLERTEHVPFLLVPPSSIYGIQVVRHI